MTDQISRDPGDLDNCALQAQAASNALHAACGSSPLENAFAFNLVLNVDCTCPLTRFKGRGNSHTCGDPVDMATGVFTYDHTDLKVADVIPLELTRSYRELDSKVRAFGVGMSDNYDLNIVGDSSGGWSSAALVLPGGQTVNYQRTSGGTTMWGAAFVANSTPGPYFGSTLTFGGAYPGWLLLLRDGTQMFFGPSRLRKKPASCRVSVSS